MYTLGIVAKYNRPELLAVVSQVEAWAAAKSIKVFFEAESATLINKGNGLPVEDLVRVCNPLITLGGDGTLIRIARHAADFDRTIIGVNFGNLGFLTEVAPEDLIQTLDTFLAKKVQLANRAMIKAQVFRAGKEVFSCRALNDAVILKSSLTSLIDLDITKDQEEMMRLRADGLIFATPTGSTAYSLAAGGSIAYPALSVLLITPICPHSLTNRPLIMPLEAEYFVSIPEYEGSVTLTMDGQESFELISGDLIKLTKAKASLQFVRSASKSYFEILRSKLHWSRANDTKNSRS